jgi:signal transduction histidine kinase
MKAKSDAVTATEQVRAELRRRTLNPLIGRGLAGLGVLGASGFLVGWFVAGRSLRPIQQITATARVVAAGDLDQRIALTGPRDELRELADTFDAMMDRLEAAFDNQRAFIGNASHELKTPIAINRTLLDVAVTDPDAPREVVELGGALLEVNARQQRIVEALLTLARSDAGLPDARTVDLGALLGEGARRIEPAASVAEVTVELAVEAIRLDGDPRLLERLIDNLLQNAVTYNVRNGWVRVRLGAHAGGALLQIDNTGPLVPAAAVPALFEPFRRIRDRVSAGSGTGLGLSIVRAIARAHGGTVDAEARPDGGLVVRVGLPIQAPSREQAAAIPGERR